MYRIAVGSLFIECNHLGGVPTTIEFFKRSELCRDADVLSVADGTVGGMLHVLRESSAKIAPLIVAMSCPSGPLTNDCYSQLKTEMLSRLRNAGDVDGVLLALHGSASAENAGDVEGDLLSAVREYVGRHVMIVASLDLHAHVTETMVQNADALVAWETYPHRDAFSTGERAANLLVATLQGRVQPRMALAKAPVLVGGVMSGTEDGSPFADVMRLAKSMERQAGILSTSAFLVHPYLDLADMGGGGLVITDNDMNKASELATEIAEYYWSRRHDLEPDVFVPAEAIRQGLQIDGLVLLSEASDTCGGGAAGDSVAALKALLESAKYQSSLVPVVDPQAALRCHELGIGASVELDLGHSLEPRWGTPVRVHGHVTNVTDGTFKYVGGIYEGQTGEMGPSAVVDVGAIRILISSHATYDWADEQFRSMDMDPELAKFIVVKNPMNFRVAYADKFQAAYILDTPGCTPATLRHIQHKNVKRPYFPADPEIPNFRPHVVRSSHS